MNKKESYLKKLIKEEIQKVLKEDKAETVADECIQVVRNFEDELSDGFSFYTSSEEDTFRRMRQKFIDVLTKFGVI